MAVDSRPSERPSETVPNSITLYVLSETFSPMIAHSKQRINVVCVCVCLYLTMSACIVAISDLRPLQRTSICVNDAISIGIYQKILSMHYVGVCVVYCSIERICNCNSMRM